MSESNVLPVVARIQAEIAALDAVLIPGAERRMDCVALLDTLLQMELRRVDLLREFLNAAAEFGNSPALVDAFVVAQEAAKENLVDLGAADHAVEALIEPPAELVIADQYGQGYAETFTNEEESLGEIFAAIDTKEGVVEPDPLGNAMIAEFAEIDDPVPVTQAQDELPVEAEPVVRLLTAEERQAKALEREGAERARIANRMIEIREEKAAKEAKREAKRKAAAAKTKYEPPEGTPAALRRTGSLESIEAKLIALFGKDVAKGKDQAIYDEKHLIQATDTPAFWVSRGIESLDKRKIIRWTIGGLKGHYSIKFLTIKPTPAEA